MADASIQTIHMMQPASPARAIFCRGHGGRPRIAAPPEAYFDADLLLANSMPRALCCTQVERAFVADLRLRGVCLTRRRFSGILPALSRLVLDPSSPRIHFL